MSTSRKSVFTNMIWRFAERCGAQGVSFIVSLVLARLLTPDIYGIVSLITVFTTIMQIFVDSGFSRALIQKKDADQLDFSTVFFFNVGMGILLYGLMFVFAPTISRFYQKDFMTPYIRVMSLTLVLGGVNSVQHTIVAKRMIFKKFFFATLIGTVISAFVGIYMAYKGMGVWALIAQKLVNQTFDTLFLWISLKWRPSWQFSLTRLKPLFRYGSRLLGSSILDSFTNNLTGVLVGKVYTTEELAYYEKGQHVPFLVVENLQTAVQSVLFPVIAKEQDNRAQVKNILRKSVMTSAYCIFPCMTGIAVCSTPLIRLLFAEKWMNMAPYMQVWCFICALYLLHTANLQVIQAMGRSDIFLKLEIIKQAMALGGLLISIRFGVLPMLITSSVLSAVSYFLNAYPNKSLADYGFLAQIKDLAPIILLNLIMGGIVFAAGCIPAPDWLKLIVQATVGVAVYVGGSWLMKLEIFTYMLEILKGGLHK